MILLRPDCLVFETANGENFPCPVQEVVIELIGDSARTLDEATIENASAAVLHYFRTELGKTSVTIGEFSLALEQALRSLGFSVHTASAELAAVGNNSSAGADAVADLVHLAREAGGGFELLFFPRLRAELQRLLAGTPRTLRFHGLRDCVKQITGARRWNKRCRELQDQIVIFLRECLGSESSRQHCTLVVR